VPWGALGVGTVIGADLARMDFGALSDASALLSLPLFPVYGVAAVALAGGWSGVRRRGCRGCDAGTRRRRRDAADEPLPRPGVVRGHGRARCDGRLPRAEVSVGITAVPVRALLPYGFLLALLAGVTASRPSGPLRAAQARFLTVLVCLCSYRGLSRRCYSGSARVRWAERGGEQ
jgi:lactate permease